MTIAGIDPKCYILALFVRDDGVRFLLGDDPYEFKDKQLHFQPNTVANDVVEVQGNDGYLLAGQVRRPGTQSFDGYVCNGTNSKAEVETKRREFLQFFRRSHFYKVIYVFPNGTAIQRKQGFLVDDPTVQELYQQYPEYHVALNFEDVNYYTYEEDDQGQEIYAKEAIVPLAGGGATGRLIWDEYGVVWEDPWSNLVSVSGSEIQIENEAGAMASIQDLELQGDTEQNETPTPDAPITVQTVTGEQTVAVTRKNLLDKDRVNQYMGYFDGNADNPTLISGATGRNRVIYVKCKPNTTYSISLLDRTGIDNPQVGTTDSLPATGVAVAKLGTFPGGSLKFENLTTSATAQYLCIRFQTNSPSVEFDNIAHTLLSGLQIEYGSTATSYEPYQVQSYIIDLRGKNILNISDFEMGGLSNGNPTPSTFRINNALHAIAVQPNTTYTLSAQLVSPVQGFRVGIHEIDRNGSFLRDLGWEQLGTGAFTMTTNSDTYYLKIVGSLSTTSTNVSTGGTENTTACTTVTEFMRGCTLMLEKGSTATDYEPYNAIELCKIGDYQDDIYKSGEDWYVHKETKKVIYEGSEEWTRSTYDGTNSFYILDSDAALVGSTSLPPIFSDMFTRKVIADCWNMGNEFNAIAMYNISGQIRVFFPQSLANTVDAFKSWLNTHNVVAYYAIATPTDTQITDATLVEQLNTLGVMKLFIGENNLLVSATGTNLPVTLEFSYPTKFAAIGAEWEEGGTKGATIVDVNAIDNTYPVWELMGPAVNPTISVLTTNTTLTYNGTITASQKLVIDMFNKTATLNGTSVIGNVSGDFVYMAPRTNRIAYTAGNTDAPDSTIYWQEVVG